MNGARGMNGASGISRTSGINGVAGDPTLALIAWTRNPGRFNDIGGVLGVEPKVLDFPLLRRRWLAPLRYGLCALATVAWLLRRRPRMTIVSCPPPFAALLVAAYACLSRKAFVLDAHPGAFGHRDRLWRLFVPAHKLLVRLARVTMVTEPALAEIVERWGGSPIVFHEAPPAMAPARPAAAPARLAAAPEKDARRAATRPRVLFATIFDPDEPLADIATAASLLAECDVFVTGDYSRLPHELKRKLLKQSHIQLTGWLDQVHYLQLVAGADVVVALTQDPHSVMRSAFEAAYLERATVLSDTATLRACFSPSVFVKHTPAAIVRGVRGIVAERGSWEQPMRERHYALMRRWANQLAALQSVIAQADGQVSYPRIPQAQRS